MHPGPDIPLGRFSVLFSCENIGEGTERFSKKRQILWQEVPNIIEKHSAILLVHHKGSHKMQAFSNMPPVPIVYKVRPISYSHTITL